MLLAFRPFSARLSRREPNQKEAVLLLPQPNPSHPPNYRSYRNPLSAALFLEASTTKLRLPTAPEPHQHHSGRVHFCLPAPQSVPSRGIDTT